MEERSKTRRRSKRRKKTIRRSRRRRKISTKSKRGRKQRQRTKKMRNRRRKKGRKEIQRADNSRSFPSLLYPPHDTIKSTRNTTVPLRMNGQTKVMIITETRYRYLPDLRISHELNLRLSAI
jgi:hypothetical protein